MRVEGEKKEKTNLLFRLFPITDVLAWHRQKGRWHIIPVEERYLLAEQAGRKRKRTRVRRWKNKSWKENDGVRLNGQVVNALWDWVEEVVECSVSSITPHKSGGLLSLPAFALNYLSPVHTYSSSLMASSHSPSHATGHRGHLHTVYVLCQATYSIHQLI